MMIKIAVVACASLLLSGNVAFGSPVNKFKSSIVSIDMFNVHYLDQDSNLADMFVSFMNQATSEIEKVFAHPFPSTINLYVYPNRQELDKYWRVMFDDHDFQSECWMVGSADRDVLAVLSPNVWKDEACDGHDPDDHEHIRRLVKHEATHVFHGLYHPTSDFDDETGWFVEGLATFVSGQLPGRHLERAKEAIREGRAPSRLSEAWSGSARYGISGTMVSFLASRFGYERLFTALSRTTNREILAAIGVSERCFLRKWREYVLKEL